MEPLAGAPLASLGALLYDDEAQRSEHEGSVHSFESGYSGQASELGYSGHASEFGSESLYRSGRSGSYASGYDSYDSGYDSAPGEASTPEAPDEASTPEAPVPEPRWASGPRATEEEMRAMYHQSAQGMLARADDTSHTRRPRCRPGTGAAPVAAILPRAFGANPHVADVADEERYGRLIDEAHGKEMVGHYVDANGTPVAEIWEALPPPADADHCQPSGAGARHLARLLGHENKQLRSKAEVRGDTNPAEARDDDAGLAARRVAKVAEVQARDLFFNRKHSQPFPARDDARSDMYDGHNDRRAPAERVIAPGPTWRDETGQFANPVRSHAATKRAVQTVRTARVEPSAQWSRDPLHGGGVVDLSVMTPPPMLADTARGLFAPGARNAHAAHALLTGTVDGGGGGDRPVRPQAAQAPSGRPDAPGTAPDPRGALDARPLHRGAAADAAAALDRAAAPAAPMRGESDAPTAEREATLPRPAPELPVFTASPRGAPEALGDEREAALPRPVPVDSATWQRLDRAEPDHLGDDDDDLELLGLLPPAAPAAAGALRAPVGARVVLTLKEVALGIGAGTDGYGASADTAGAGAAPTRPAVALADDVTEAEEARARGPAAWDLAPARAHPEHLRPEAPVAPRAGARRPDAPSFPRQPRAAAPPGTGDDAVAGARPADRATGAPVRRAGHDAEPEEREMPQRAGAPGGPDGRRPEPGAEAGLGAREHAARERGVDGPARAARRAQGGASRDRDRAPAGGAGHRTDARASATAAAPARASVDGMHTDRDGAPRDHRRTGASLAAGSGLAALALVLHVDRLLPSDFASFRLGSAAHATATAAGPSRQTDLARRQPHALPLPYAPPAAATTPYGASDMQRRVAPARSTSRAQAAPDRLGQPHGPREMYSVLHAPPMNGYTERTTPMPAARAASAASAPLQPQRTIGHSDTPTGSGRETPNQHMHVDGALCRP